MQGFDKSPVPKRSKLLGKRADRSPYKGDDEQLQSLVLKLDTIISNQEIIIKNLAKENEIVPCADDYDTDYIADIVDFGDDWTNPNYINFRISSKTLLSFANSADGKRTVKIRKKNKEEDKYLFFCKSCHKFAIPEQNERDENYRKGYLLTKAELEDAEIMRSKRRGLTKHFKKSVQHYRAEIQFILYKNGLRHTLLLKGDIYYHMALNPKSSKKSFEGQIIIIYNEKERSQCKCKDCCNIGKKGLSKRMVARWQQLTFDYLRMQLRFSMSRLSTVSNNIIFYSITMDGYDIGLYICLFCLLCFCFVPFVRIEFVCLFFCFLFCCLCLFALVIVPKKWTVMAILVADWENIKCYLIGLDEFQYSEENKVKSLEEYTKQIATALKQEDILH